MGENLLQWFGHGWATHVDVVYGDVVLGALPKGGVKQRLKKDFQYKRTQTFELQTTQEIKDKFDQFILAQLGKPYDWRSIFSFVIPFRDWREDDSWFCSELIAAGLEQSGFLRKLDLNVTKITPQDLMLICEVAREYANT